MAERLEIAERLGGSQVGLRPELEVTRHLFRGKVSYVVRDPITFASHRFDAGDYEVLTAIHSDHTLDEIFKRLVDEEKLDEGDAEDYYRFVITLHRLGFLSLPLPDGKRLYQSYLTKERQKRAKRWMGIFFLQLPLVNPDHWLSRTVRWVSPLFSRGALALWSVLIISAGFVASRRWDDLTDEVGDLFGAQNIPVLWLTIVVLKVIHEFGHAYATKAFGGHVPEMGVYLIALTPCAYVDASAAWGFSRKIERIFVGLAGMYFELVIASFALFGWAATEDGLLHSLLFNVVMLSSAVTVGFNINPLMRFDGYYVLSDLLELPNLRQRATAAMVAVGKRIAIGPRPGTTTEDCLRTRLILCGFGAFSALYRMVVIVTISMLIASKFFLVGLVMAGMYVTIEVLKLLRRVLTYLWFSQETSTVRFRAVAVSVLLLLVIGITLFGVPLPSHVHAAGSVGTEGDFVIRAERPGFIEAIFAEPGIAVRPGQQIAELSDLSALGAVVEARTSLAQAETRAFALALVDRPLATQELETVRYFRERLTEKERSLETLTLRSEGAGWVARCVSAEQTGRYLRVGEEVATIAAGRWTVVVYLSAEEMAAASPKLGERAQFRPKGNPTTRLAGRVYQVEPVATDEVAEKSLTRTAGGEIGIDPISGRAGQKFFRVTIAVDPDPDGERVRHGMTGMVRFGANPEPLALVLWRRVLIFLNHLDVG